MKPLRSHDRGRFSFEPGNRPNARALRAILAALTLTAFIFCCVVIALLPAFHRVPNPANPR